MVAPREILLHSFCYTEKEVASMHISAIYKAIMLLIPLIVFAESELKMDRQSFILLSDSFAYELGKTYQMGKNCKKELRSIASDKAAGLFIKYMKEHEVQQTMDNYEQGIKSKRGMPCEGKELKAYVPVLQTKITDYFKTAAPFMRSHAD